jgi:transcriptional regulator
MCVRHTPSFLLTDEAEVKRLIRENPWATIVSNASTGLVASHYPVVLEEHEPGISIVSHVGRPDEQLHELGRHEVLVIIQGAHGYISPSWYPPEQRIPTWNHVTAHLYGVPELLSDDENLRVLGELVDIFEQRMPNPVRLDTEPHAARIAKGTVGLRLRVTRFDARAKLSQNKAPGVVDDIIGALESGGAYSHDGLAAEMRRAHRRDPR